MKRKPDRRELELPEQYEYHYSREERLGMAPKEVQDPSWRRTGILRGNKPLKIMLIDLLVIVIGFTLVTQILPLIRRDRTLAGYRLTLSAFAYDADLLITLRAERPARSRQSIDQGYGAVRRGDGRPGAGNERNESVEVRERLSGTAEERLPCGAAAWRGRYETGVRRGDDSGETRRLETPVRRE